MSVATMLGHIRLGPFGRLRLHPLFLLLVLVAVGAGFWEDIVFLFLLILLHELGHAVAAEALGYEVEQVSLLPFGGVARLSHGTLGFSPRHEMIIAVAGPAVNVLWALASWLCHAAGLYSQDVFQRMVSMNLWIAAFNMLPGLPLDGGRVLRAVRSRSIGYEAATREAYVVSSILAGILLVIGGVALWSGTPHVGVLILGVFLVVSVFAGLRDTTMETIRFLDARQKASRRPETVRALAAPGITLIRDVVVQFSPERYHLVYVLAEDGRVLTILEESELLEAVFGGHWLDSLETWIAREE